MAGFPHVAAGIAASFQAMRGIFRVSLCIDISSIFRVRLNMAPRVYVQHSPDINNHRVKGHVSPILPRMHAPVRFGILDAINKREKKTEIRLLMNV